MQGMLLWLEATQNKNSLIISKHAHEPGCIKKSQAKAIVPTIDRHNTQTERVESGSNQPHTGYVCYIQINLSNLIINLISREKTRISMYKVLSNSYPRVKYVSSAYTKFRKPEKHAKL